MDVGPRWGQPTPPWVIQQLKILLQIILKVLFNMAKCFVEINYAELKIKMQLKMKCKN